MNLAEFFKRLFSRKDTDQRQAASLSDSAIVELLRGESISSSGVTVTPDNALTYAVVMACVRVLSESVSTLPLFVYRRMGDGKQRASEHPLYGLLHDQPNPDMTAVTFRETQMVHLCMWGNSYSEIIFDGAGRVRELWPLQPSGMQVSRKGGRMVYEYWEPGTGKPTTYPARRILHVTGLSTDGLIGLNPIDASRNDIGYGLTLNAHGARTFANGARPGLVLEHPGHLTPEAAKKLRASFDSAYTGEGVGRTAVLEEGMKINTFGFPNQTAQYLESRKFQVAEIARIYRVPAHMVGDLEHATFSNIEQMSINFVVHTLRPWLVRIEQAEMMALLSEAERQEYYIEHLVDGLLRGDMASRYAAYAVGRQWGWLSADDVRDKENMNPLPGGSGQAYLTPLNMGTAGQPGNP